MKSNTLFYIGVALDVFALLIALSTFLMMSSPLQSSDGTVYDTSDGLTTYGKMMRWLIPLFFLVLIGVGFWLRSNGKILAANILVWIPALPMLGGILIWGGLAALFVLFGK